MFKPWMDLPILRPLTRRLRAWRRERKTGIKVVNATRVLASPLRGDGPSRPGAAFRLLDYDLGTASYKFVTITPPFDLSPTAESLGMRAVPVIRMLTAAGDPFVELAMPEGADLLYHRLLPSRAWMADFYSNAYDRTNLARSQDAETLKRKRSANKVEAYCRPFMAPGSRVLDVGCGFGDQLSFFKAAGHRTLGVDPGLVRGQFAREQFGIEVITASLDDIPALQAAVAPQGPFDLVCLNQVLEHLVDPVAALRGLAELLAPGGMLFVAVPDIRLEGALNALFNIVHTHAFSRQGLLAVAARAGLGLVRDFMAEHYNIVLLRKAEVAPPPVPAKPEVLSEILAGFGLAAKGLRCRDLVLQESNVLGIQAAVLRYVGEPLPAFGVEQLRAHLPLTIETSFDEPQVLVH